MVRFMNSISTDATLESWMTDEPYRVLPILLYRVYHRASSGPNRPVAKELDSTATFC